MSFLQLGQLTKKIVRSPINPILLLCIFISIPLFILATQTKGYMSITFIAIATVIIILFFIAYFYLLFKNPEYLRSEHYQFQMNQIRFHYGDKDNPKSIEINNINSLIKNPHQDRLPKVKENESK